MIRTLLLALLLAATAASADVPAQFSVTGVAADDVLNIRAEPDASSPIVGQLSHIAFNVEVIELAREGSWGLVATPEGNGWVSMRFMARQQVPAGTLPRPLSCLGTEPFWRIGLWPRGSEFELMGEERRSLTALTERVAENGYLVVLEEGPTLNRTLIVQRGGCYDGMSDRRYGFSGMLYTDAPDESFVLSGCCTLDGN